MSSSVDGGAVCVEDTLKSVTEVSVIMVVVVSIGVSHRYPV